MNIGFGKVILIVNQALPWKRVLWLCEQFSNCPPSISMSFMGSQMNFVVPMDYGHEDQEIFSKYREDLGVNG